jgi:hypothetical protein
MLKCPLIYYCRERLSVFVNTFIVFVGELRGLFNKCLNSGTNSKVLVKILLNNNMVGLVSLSRVYSQVKVSVSVSMTELKLLWLVKGL